MKFYPPNFQILLATVSLIYLSSFPFSCKITRVTYSCEKFSKRNFPTDSQREREQNHLAPPPVFKFHPIIESSRNRQKPLGVRRKREKVQGLLETRGKRQWPSVSIRSSMAVIALTDDLEDLNDTRKAVENAENRARLRQGKTHDSQLAWKNNNREYAQALHREADQLYRRYNLTGFSRVIVFVSWFETMITTEGQSFFSREGKLRKINGRQQGNARLWLAFVFLIGVPASFYQTRSIRPDQTAFRQAEIGLRQLLELFRWKISSRPARSVSIPR